MLKVKSIILGILLSQQALAGLSIPGISNSQLHGTENALSKAGLTEFQDEVVEEKEIELTAGQNHQAKVWNLTEAEEKRYLQLMQSRSGIYYQGLHMSPIDILGLNARNDAERAHFAELAAKQEAQKVAQNIAWNNAFYKRITSFLKIRRSLAILIHHLIHLMPINRFNYNRAKPCFYSSSRMMR